MPKSSAKSSRKTKTAPFDVADYLHAPEDMAAYLKAWLDEAPDDAAGIARALGAIARAKGMGQIAKQATANLNGPDYAMQRSALVGTPLAGTASGYYRFSPASGAPTARRD